MDPFPPRKTECACRTGPDLCKNAALLCREHSSKAFIIMGAWRKLVELCF